MTDNSWTVSSPMKTNDPKTESLLMEKVTYLQKEFELMDSDHNAWVSKQELLDYLDRKTPNEPFDRNIAQELFDHMDTDKNGQITINEFIKTYLEADEILKKKIESTKNNKEYYNQQYNECIKKAEEAKMKEEYTPAGIIKGSYVSVSILEAQVNRPSLNSAAAFYVEIFFVTGQSQSNKQNYRTKTVTGLNPQWNEETKFEVSNPQSQIQFEFGDQVRGTQYEGQLTVPLMNIADQELHDEWLELQERRGDTSVRLHINIQWIHSRSQYYAAAAQKWQVTMRNEEDELIEYKKYVNNLHSPFPFMDNPSQYKPENKASGNPDEIEKIEGITPFEGMLHHYMKKGALITAQQKEPNDVFWLKTLKAASLVEAVIAVFIMFTRPDFLDLLIAFTLFFYADYGEFRQFISTPKSFTFFIWGSALLLDGIWFLKYAGNWTAPNYKDCNLENGSRKLALTLTFINIFVKIIIGGLLYALHIQLVKKKVIKPDVPAKPY